MQTKLRYVAQKSDRISKHGQPTWKYTLTGDKMQ